MWNKAGVLVFSYSSIHTFDLCFMSLKPGISGVFWCSCANMQVNKWLNKNKIPVAEVSVTFKQLSIEHPIHPMSSTGVALLVG